MGDEKPDLSGATEVTAEMVICPRHGELFRSKWPLGYASFCLSGMNRLLQNQDFEDECRGDASKLQEALQSKPICCRLSKEQLLRTYEDVQRTANVWTLDRCVNCGERKHGAPFTSVDNLNREFKWDHICLRCVVYRTVHIHRN